MVSDSTLHAVVGAVVSVVLSFLPFSPVLGGAVAAYLDGAEGDDALRIGVVAGVIASIPLFLFGLVVFLFGTFFLGFGLLPHGPGVGVGILGFFLVVVVGGAFLALYTVGLSALGGYLGAYFVDEA